MRIFPSALFALLMFTVPVFAVTINSPSSGDTVTSPFTLSASSATCSSVSVRTIGYSLDSGSDIAQIHAQAIDVKVSASAGEHTVHVKAWNTNGAVCVAEVKIKVAASSDDSSDASSDASAGPPSGATSVSSIQALSSWKSAHDSGTSGSSSGSTKLVGSPSHSGTTREFSMSFKGDAGERYSKSFGDNATSLNFFYDAWVYIKSPSTHIANIEMDLNQTMPNGDTVIFGVQCAAGSGKWEYTENLGTAKKPKGHWAASSAACSPRKWSTGTWHHVQAEYSRTSTGHITYKYIWFDGTKYTLNKTVFGARAMGWADTLLTNFQIDGASTGTATVYLDELKISRW